MRQDSVQKAKVVVEGVPVHESVKRGIKTVRGVEIVVNVDQRAKIVSKESTTVRVGSVTTNSEAIKTIRRNIRRTDRDLGREINAMYIELTLFPIKPFSTTIN